jgi:ABC-type lipoprotein export system ATPase subunit
LKAELLENKMQDVSGGEKQRIALVSCLLLQREILLLDEPTSALDSHSKSKVMDYLFANPKLTILSSSHDPEWIARCSKIVSLS